MHTAFTFVLLLLWLADLRFRDDAAGGNEDHVDVELFVGNELRFLQVVRTYVAVHSVSHASS